jgi:hypothetical protein
VTPPGDGRGRLFSVLRSISEQPDGDIATMVCDAAASHLRVPATALTVAVDGRLVPVAATEPATSVEALLLELQEGPSYDAHLGGGPVAAPDLAQGDRWVRFTPAVTRLGFGAAFAFPVRAGEVPLGTFNLYRTVPGPLTAETHANALVFASAAVGALGATDEPEEPADGPGRRTDDVDIAWPEIQQAVGMVSVQLGAGLDEALLALEVHAASTGRPLAEVARDVVERRLRLGEAP